MPSSAQASETFMPPNPPPRQNRTSSLQLQESQTNLSSESKPVHVKREEENPPSHYSSQSGTIDWNPMSSPPIQGLMDPSYAPQGLSLEQAMNMNDFDRFVGHEDFARLVTVAAKVKALRTAIIGENGGIPDSSIMSLSADPRSNEVEETANVIRQNVRTDDSTTVVPRGMFPQTDSMVDEAIGSLAKELDRCLTVQNEVSANRKKNRVVRSPRRKKKRGEGGEAIAVKYSKGQTDILTDWMIRHRDHPFPDSNQINELSRAANLTHSQVVNWTTNVRKRNLKATVEHGKKPHHFLDFLFLAEDREKRWRAAQSGDHEMAKAKKMPRSPRAKSPTSPKRSRAKKKAPKTGHHRAQGASANYHARVASASPLSQHIAPGGHHPPYPVAPRVGSKYSVPYAIPYHGNPPPLPAPFQHPGYPTPMAHGYPPYYPSPMGMNQHHHYQPPHSHYHPQSQHTQSQGRRSSAGSTARPVSPSYEASCEAISRRRSGAGAADVTMPPLPFDDYVDKKIITPASSGSPTTRDSFRDLAGTIQDVDVVEGLRRESVKEFWNAGLLEKAEKRHSLLSVIEAYPSSEVEDEEKMSLMKVTEGGLVSTPRSDDDEEEDPMWFGPDALLPAVTAEECSPASPYEPMPYSTVGSQDFEKIALSLSSDVDKAERTVSLGRRQSLQPANRHHQAVSGRRGSHLDGVKQEQLDTMRRSLTDQDMEDALAISDEFGPLNEEDIIKELLSESSPEGTIAV